MSSTSKIVVAKERKSNMLPEYKVKFIEMLISSGALKVGGDFTLKSKRESPYFINVGGFNSGTDTMGLANAYANTITEHLKGKFDLLYGIPEKGVGLAPTISIELAREHNVESNWFFTRKTEKAYGEATNLPKAELAKSKIVGKLPESGSRIVLLDDVFTTGDAKYGAIEELNRLLDKPQIVALVIAVDRQEVGIDGKSAIQEFTEKTGIPVYSILKATEIRQYLSSKPEPDNVGLHKMGSYLRAFGTVEASSQSELLVEMPKVVCRYERSIIPACDISDIQAFEVLVRETSKVEGIGGYKIGFELALGYGLPRVVETARKYTDKPLIYDHQKAGTDIPDTGKKFMTVNKKAGIDAVILFPQSGPETERAWIYRALDNSLGVIVGGRMTHPAYSVSEGGFIADEGALEMYRIAARAGIRNFVVPGTKPDVIRIVNDVVRGEGVDPIFYAPGFGAQLGNFNDVKAVLGNNWHAIVGRAIVNAQNGEYGKAAEENVEQLLRAQV
jgi:orotidine-5'-phosphate decarboxylase